MPSTLTKEEQRYKKRVYNYLVIKAGIAVEEAGEKRTSQLHSESTDNYRQLVESFNLIANYEKFRTTEPRNDNVDLLKAELLEEAISVSKVSYNVSYNVILNICIS